MEKGEVSPPSGYAFRTACQMCEYPVPQADIILKLFGYKADQEIGMEIGEKLEKEIEEKGILSFSENEPPSRSEVVNRVIAERTKKRDALFQEFKGMVKDLPVFPGSILHLCPMPQLHGGLSDLLLQGVCFQNSGF